MKFHFPKQSSASQAGFTLLEILLVVAIIAILAGIVIVAINPSKQLADSRNTQRRADVTTILNGVYQYAIDTNGTIPSTITVGTACGVATQEICKTSAACVGLTDLSTSLVGTNAKYLVSIPIDPTGSSTLGTGYQVYKSATTNRVTVCAPSAENGATISVTR